MGPALEAVLMIARAVKKVVQIGHAKKTSSIGFVSVPWL